jgi:glycosyltransferase involved in cell wall biosynthesis
MNTTPKTTGRRRMLTIGFVVSFDDDWLGGVNYLRNLLSAIDEDPDRRVEAVVLTGVETPGARLTELPCVRVVRDRLLDKGSFAARLRRLAVRATSTDVMLDRLLRRHRIDVLSHSTPMGKGARTPAIAWVPDLQHVHLPQFFSADDRAGRDRHFRLQCEQSDSVIVSSEAARHDLEAIHPEVAGKVEVLRFVPKVDLAVPVPALETLERRHGFRGPFIHLPNQFWVHKNHSTVIEALARLRNAGRTVTVVSTGSTADCRHPGHFPSLVERIEALGLTGCFRILGVVPYAELIGLMTHSVCVLNPSLFEGWSTTVEEAKALGKPVVLSDIAVHREQNPARATFFPPRDAAALADAMWSVWEQAHELPAQSDGARERHDERRIRFSRRYQSIAERAASRRTRA